MIRLTFGGWIECRLATDPDPSDERWGVSGYAIAYSGEPPLDRKLQTRSSKAVNRKFAPEIGITVKDVEVDEQGSAEKHPLLGAEVHFEEEPVFEGRNDLVAADTIEPILPVSLSVTAGKVVVRRELRRIEDGEWAVVQAPGTQARLDMLAESGVKNPKVFLEHRITDLEQSTPSNVHEETSFRERLIRLRQRLADGQVAEKEGANPLFVYNTGGPVPMPVGMNWRYVFEGPWFSIVDPDGELPQTIQTSEWICDLWIGCWDADVLCAYAHGVLTLPSLHATESS